MIKGKQNKLGIKKALGTQDHLNPLVSWALSCPLKDTSHFHLDFSSVGGSCVDYLWTISIITLYIIIIDYVLFLLSWLTETVYLKSLNFYCLWVFCWYSGDLDKSIHLPPEGNVCHYKDYRSGECFSEVGIFPSFFPLSFFLLLAIPP